MKLYEFLQDCHQKNIRFKLSGDAIKISAPPNTLNDETVALVRTLKPEIIDWLKEASKAVVDEQASDTQSSLNIPVSKRLTALPASYNQEQMWLSEAVDDVGQGYHFCRVLHLSGVLNNGALERAFDTIVQRHETLRTNFYDDSGVVCQRVHDATFGEIPVLDLSEKDIHIAESEAESAAIAFETLPFDLAGDLMMRCTLIKLADDYHQLVVVLHHIASDGWSLGVLVNELSESYTELTEGTAAVLDTLPRQYVDFADWQRQQVSTGAFNDSIQYWKQSLGGAPDVHSLPTDFPRPKRRKFHGETLTQRIDFASLGELKSIAQTSGSTLFMVLHTLFGVILSKYSQSNDLVIGTPAANRSHESLSGLIGYFVNMLPLRNTYDSAATFKQTLASVTKNSQEAFEHQHVPFDQIVQTCAAHRSASYNPLIQIAFAFQNNDIPEFELPGLQCSISALKKNTTLFDLQLDISEDAHGLALTWEYSTELFKPNFIQALAKHFLQLTRAAIVSPNTPINELDYLNEEEKNNLLYTWNEQKADYPHDKSLGKLFNEQVAKTPHNVATVFDDATLTYTQLNEKSNQLAEYLRVHRGVERGAMVGVCMDRSSDMVIAILAIVKAGAAYVPLDREYPEARLRYMMEDAKLNTVITHRAIFGQSPIPAAAALCLDDDTVSAGMEKCSTHVKAEATAQDHAYIIYTSGSTGNPKGVQVDHRAVVRLVKNTNYISLTSDSVVAQASNMSFDAMTFEFWGALLNGGQLVYVAKNTLINPKQLGNALREKNIDTLFITTALFNAIANESPTALANLNALLFGGEDCSPTAIETIVREGKPEHLLHVYGPTENTTFSLWKELTAEYVASTHKIALGNVISNTAGYVLDAHRRLCPVGVVGELYLAGAGTARGYLNREALSAEVFLNNPFHKTGSQCSGPVMYKTGDLVRRLQNGDLEFIGRVDHQVKIRGFRIELGEIEHALTSMPSIREAFVMAHTTARGDKQLLAYIAPNRDDDTLIKQILEKTSAALQWSGEIEAVLANMLPDYMVPSAFIVLPHLPITPNGKVDRKALPEPTAQLLVSEYVAPANETEQTLCEACETLLNVEKIGRHDNFFQLGGHSLMVMRLVATIKEQGYILDARDVFSARTFADLAHCMAAVEAHDASENVALNYAIPEGINRLTADVLPLINLSETEMSLLEETHPGGIENLHSVYPLSPLQDGILFHHMMNQTCDPYILTAQFVMPSAESAHTFIDGLQNVINRHEALRTNIRWQGLSRPFQTVSRAVALPVTWLTFDNECPLNTNMRVIGEQHSKHMDLELKPLIEVVVGQSEGQRSCGLLLTFHHIILDHVGLDIIKREIAAHSEGHSASLEPAAQYGHFIAASLQDDATSRATTYFSETLGDVDEVTAPFGLTEVQGNGANIIESNTTLSAYLSERTRAIAKIENVSPGILFHAAWAMVVGACSGRDDIVFGSVLSGRMQGVNNIGNMLGVFINTLPFRINLENVNAESFVQAIQHRLRELMAVEQAPLALAQNCSGIETAQPLFSAILNYRHTENTASLEDKLGFTLVETVERSNYPFNLCVDDLGDNFLLTAQVDAVLSPERIVALVETALEQLVTLLETKSDQKINAISVLSAQERSTLLHEWSEGPKKQTMPFDLIHQTFEHHATSVPSSVAIILGEQQLSYGELNEQANKLAHYLRREATITPDTLIGVCLERSFNMVITMLAIVKAGGAYLPIDPNYPRARLQFIVEDSGLSTIVTTQSLATLFEQASIIALDDTTVSDAITAECANNITASSAALMPQHLAYAIYTSGSTGKPKASLLTHSGLCNLADTQRQSLTVEENYSRVLQFASVAFDAATWEWVMALANGATLVLMTSEQQKTPEALDELVQLNNVTHATLPPVLLPLLNREKWRSVSTLVVAGEACPEKVAAQWCEGRTFINAYGPSETTVCATMGHYSAHSTALHMGKPIQNMSAYVLNTHQELAPIGVPGELYIGGQGVGREYLNRDALTREKFIPNPFSNTRSRSSDTLYRTGDLVRWLEDGNLEFLGRIDHQVKIRGLRIELGEIENTLLAQATVDNAIVVAQDNARGDKSLVAYVASNNEAVVKELHTAQGRQPENAACKTEEAQLRLALHAALPDYMVPTGLVLLPTLPVTVNGKIDRKALPAFEPSDAQAEFVAPISETQKRVAAIWQDVLQRDNVGLHDNFFQHGGHSLLAARAIGRMNAEFSLALPLTALFDQKTIIAISTLIDSQSDRSVDNVIGEYSRDNELLASFSQQRLWVLDKIDGGSAHYNMPSVLALTGSLDYKAVEQAFNRIVQRHESVRTQFYTNENGDVCQRIRPFVTQPVGFHDVSTAGDEQAITTAWQTLAKTEAALAFDLDHDYCIRASIIKLNDTEHRLLVTAHHIAFDGWSSAILMREFTEYYTASTQQRSAQLMPLSIQYADYAQWQREKLQGDALETELDHWQGNLDHLPVVHSLPLDKPRPAVQTYNGCTYTSVLSEDNVGALKALCQRTDATLFMGLHAALSVLLSRYSNETDIVIGCPTANREQQGIAELIGFFVNNLVLRSELSESDCFNDVLQKSKCCLKQAYDHQQVPFEKIVERLQPQRSLSHSPLFQIMLVLQNNEEADLSLPGLQLQHIAEGNTVSKYDLTLHVTENEGHLNLGWEFNTDLFLPATIARMANHFDRVLSAALAAPTDNIYALEMLDNDECVKQLHDWNKVTPNALEHSAIHRYFERKVDEQPKAIAVVFEDETLTYEQLNGRANQLAHFMVRERGIVAGELVGISVDRSLNMIVGILAVLKAGGAYVPFDPDYPVDRLAFMLQDSGVKTVITSQSVFTKTPITASQALCLDDPEGLYRFARQPLANLASPDVAITLDSLAYVIYTSGSTGKPKGVKVNHRNLMASTQARFNYYTTPLTAFLLLSPCSFDSSIAGIFWSLMSGAKLVVPDKSRLSKLDTLLALVNKERVNYLLSVPSLYQEMLGLMKLNGQGASSLEGVILAGEALPPALAIEHHASLGDRCALFNEYGPTEATVWSTVHKLSGTPEGSVPIGKSPNLAKLYVVNNGQLVPEGTPGELLIGGHGVSQGYLNQPALTHEKFITNPFYDDSDITASKQLYRSGDLVRWLPDGNLDFLGRVDQQVKIRGFRIELGEIENTLSAYATVKEALVIAKENASGDQYLAAYVVPESKVTTDHAAYSDALQVDMRKTLPDYMVPSAYLLLDVFPLTPNGKIDRKALPEIDLGNSQHDYRAPETTLEREICALWQDVLRLERVGMNDAFFEIGGHSLSATRLMALINKQYSLALPLNTLFSHQRVSALVAEIKRATPVSPIPDIVQADRSQPLALSYAQQRLWMLDQIDGGSAHYNMPNVLRLSGELNISALNAAFCTIVQRHESLRTRFETDTQGRALQVIDDIQTVDMPVVDIRHLPSMERETHIATLSMEEAATVFSLEHDLMIRVKLIQETDTDSLLLMTLHHIAADGWSISVLMNEFNALYNAFNQNAENPLAPLAIQYADYAHWQREWLQGDVLAEKIAYWKNQLDQLPVTHSLPLDYERPAMQSYAGETYTTLLHSSVRDQLADYCQRQGATLFMGVHTAFSALLARYSDEKDIVVGSPVANREQTDVADLIGFFVNNLVLRSDLTVNPSFSSLLNANKAMLIDAYEHQQVSFEQIVEALQPERSLSHSPLFQIMLVFQNNEQGELNIPGLSVNPVHQNLPIAKYDLTLHINESNAGLELNWEFNTDLFKRDTIMAMCESFSTLLVNMLSHPEQALFELPVLSEQQQRQPLHLWNKTTTDFPSETCFHRLFEHFAAMSPESDALILDGVHMNYAELNQRANRFARHLLTKGVTLDSLVGLCVDRSMEMVVAMLGIQKAGAAYVPIDPQYPQARIDYIVEDAVLETVVTQTSTAGLLPLEPSQLVVLDDPALVASLLLNDNSNLSHQEVAVDNNHVAYAIYTSGSTGNPKASLLEHKGLCNLVMAQRESLNVAPTSRILQFASVAFDAATWELAMALGNGAALVLMNSESAKVPDDISAVVAQTGVTHATLPPVLLPALSLEAWENVATIVVAGDACSDALAKKWSVGRRFINAYGPSETTVCATLGAYNSSEDNVLHMGTPLQNVQTYVLNESLQLAPIGTPGELYIGGVGLARQYLNRVEMTQEKFVRNPFFDSDSAAHSARLYRSGDRVRWLTDGNLEFLGRMDNQVKIRGLRIELGEIESALANIQGIDDAVVLVRTDAENDKTLVAYVVCALEHTINDDENAEYQNREMARLRRELGTRLPDYMVPSHFVLMPEFPVTSNGKVDRKALPEPDVSRVQAVYVAPTNDTEKFVCELFEELLSVERVGITDNFFHLGGHSLMATKLITRINNNFDINLALQKIFNSHTVEQLVTNIEECQLMSSIQQDSPSQTASDEMELTL